MAFRASCRSATSRRSIWSKTIRVPSRPRAVRRHPSDWPYPPSRKGEASMGSATQAPSPPFLDGRDTAPRVRHCGRRARIAQSGRSPIATAICEHCTRLILVGRRTQAGINYPGCSSLARLGAVGRWWGWSVHAVMGGLKAGSCRRGDRAPRQLGRIALLHSPPAAKGGLGSIRFAAEAMLTPFWSPCGVRSSIRLDPSLQLRPVGGSVRDCQASLLRVRRGSRP